VNDVIQGHVGDCYFHATLAQLAEHHPDVIQNAITENTATAQANDFNVRYFDASGNEQTEVVEFELTRGLDAVALSGDYDASGVEVWTHILEQAFAQTQGGYANIDEGGHADRTWEWMTGVDASFEDLQGPFFQSTDQEVADAIDAALGDNKSVMLGTVVTPGDSTILVGNHAYSLSSVDRNGAGEITAILLYNPHGQMVGTAIPVDRFNENFAFLYTGDEP